ncbi:MAG TPA: hypothetical protein VG963_18985, partial [Polyangiaceae bacterium]|nr:hypothetical protein [Polyangiaceae bacterium]
LSARTSWVTIECVDDREPPGPVANAALEIITASAEVRTTRSGETGVAFVDGIAPGRVTLRVLGVDGSLWRPLEGDAAQRSPTDERFTWHRVLQGECLSTIADRYGFKDWRDVWNFRLNQKLRERRKSPHVLCPRDMLAVPAPQLYEIVRDTEQTHRIELKSRAEVPLEVAIEDLPGEALAGQACVLRFADGAGGGSIEKAVTLDSNGCLKTTVPIHVKHLTLELVDFGETLTLALGELDPTSDAASGEANLTGVQQRLCALGYGAPTTGRLDESTRLSLVRFQRDELGRNDASGEPDAETCAKLEELHGV